MFILSLVLRCFMYNLSPSCLINTKSHERVEGANKIRGAGKMKEELKEVKKNIYIESGHQVSLVQSLSRVQLFATPWTAAHQASLSITNSRSPPKLMSIELVMSSHYFILCCPLLLLPSIFPSIRVFSNESVLYIRRPKY